MGPARGNGSSNEPTANSAPNSMNTTIQKHPKNERKKVWKRWRRRGSVVREGLYLARSALSQASLSRYRTNARLELVELMCMRAHNSKNIRPRGSPQITKQISKHRTDHLINDYELNQTN